MSNVDPTTGLPYPNLYTTADSPAVVPVDTNGYIDLGITVDPSQLLADLFGFIQLQIPGWVPADGDLEVWVMMACAQMVAALAAVAANVPVTIFQYLGGALLNLPPLVGTAAQVPTTWTMVDDSGYTVPAGTVFAFETSGNTLVQFATTAAFTVAPGQTSTLPGAVTMAAVAIGTAANGIAAGDLVPVQTLSYVATVESTATTAGGAAAETNAQYQNRLAGQLQLLTPRPILAPDFAALAVQIDGVARALALDNYNPYANQLIPPDDSFETGIGTWTATTNCTVAASAAWAASGTQSLAMTATAAGTMVATSGLYPVSASAGYTALASLHAGATAKSCTLGLAWYDINGNYLSTDTSTAADDSTSGAVAFTVNGEAPADAAQVALVVTVTAAAAGGIHYVDEAGLFLGSGPGTWTAGGLATGVERTVTVVPVDTNGDPLPSDETSALASYLEGLREVNFVVDVVPPTYTAIVVAGEVVVEYGSDSDTVIAAVQTNLDAYLSPGTWAGGGETPPVWLSDNVVYYLSVAAVIDNTPGVHHIGSLTVNGGTANVTMPGYAPLPQPSYSGLGTTVAAQGT